MEDAKVIGRLKKKQPVRIVSPEWIVDPAVSIPVRTVDLSISWIVSISRNSKKVTSTGVDPDHPPVRKDLLC